MQDKLCKTKKELVKIKYPRRGPQQNRIYISSWNIIKSCEVQHTIFVVINSDQILIKYVRVGNETLTTRGEHSVTIEQLRAAQINGAQQRVFQRSRDNFLSGSSQSYSNPKLFPNTVESLEVIIPYVKNQQRQVKLSGGRSCPWRFERSKHLHCQGTCEHDKILPVTWFIGKRVCQTFFEINSTNATLIWY